MSFFRKIFGSHSSSNENGVQSAGAALPPARGRWHRTGKSIDEKFLEEKVKYETPTSSYTQVFSPASLVQGSEPATLTVCSANGRPIAAAKVQVRNDDCEALRAAVRAGRVLLKCECAKYAEFPILYTRLFIPFAAAPVSGATKIGVRGTIAENVGKFSNADYQDWLICLAESGNTQLWVFDPSDQLLVESTVPVLPETIASIVQALDQADAALRSIPSTRQDFGAAAKAFFRDHPDPSF